MTVLDKYPCFKKYILNWKGIPTDVTPREYECLAIIAHGKRLKEAALLLNISTRTIETYLMNVRRKLSLYSLAEAIDIYWKSRECFLQ